jgi:outer membrane protein TolC
MSRLYIILLLTFGVNVAVAQDFLPLVNMAWENNHELKAKNFQLESATKSLLEAKAMYGPDVKFGIQYTLAAGGRSIAFPVGDLLNPVYSTLNQLTLSNAFPQIENVNEQFLPNNFYDARFRVTQAIYYPDLAINKKLKMEMLEQKNLEIKAFKRLVSKQTMQAYIQYVMSQNAIEIYMSADTLLQEAKRSTQSMIRNGIALPTAMSRLENQSAELLSQKSEAIGNHKNADSYLRYILGIYIDDIKTPTLGGMKDLPSIVLENPKEREELLQLKQAVKMQSLSIEKENKHYYPRIGAQFDAGSQDFDFGWQPYALLGINVDLNIYDHKKHNHRKQAAKADILATEAMYLQTESQITLQQDVARENVNTAIIQANVYESRIEATQKIYDEVFVKYKEGSAGYIELVDAQTQLTQIKLQHLVAKSNAWIKWSEYIYVTANFPIQ